LSEDIQQLHSTHFDSRIELKMSPYGMPLILRYRWMHGSATVPPWFLWS